ncbi:hypothetical protein A5819_001892 [Enterococcus sp. 7E2_DIV0204]|uniref:hypothetical protein n=1 Tax=unclassified Enterococcus TaxID=2608891 RepID=UPI000B62F18A|nr:MULTISPECIES: hypothetical protein [unclassified Enterococcus]OTN89400.1 hypothetical protein A5819_001892 [Enterococcus sp. 7E2_DIV0204]OTP51854.1 hypothetical protein A5884_001049 [Enterococcus sp. 7D2_DIV0200]
MHRLEKVGNILAEQTKKKKTVEKLKGVTDQEISEVLSLARNTVSEDLNKLLTNQETIRVKSRPVLFFSRQELEKQYSCVFDDQVTVFNHRSRNSRYKPRRCKNIIRYDQEYIGKIKV